MAGLTRKQFLATGAAAIAGPGTLARLRQKRSGKHTKYVIRRGDWKYTFYVSDMPELYNLREDPLEMNNLALSKPYQA